MKNFKTRLLILAVLLLLPAFAFAAPVGKITYVEGNVDITAGDKVRAAVLGEPVSAGDILRSKAKAKAEVTFLDGNILRLAEGTRVRITDYQMGEGKTTTMDLFRGKTQNIVSGLAKGARYEVHTPTAVCGVRGTNFFSFIHNGASGFTPSEGTIYGYNRNMPGDIKTVTPGSAIIIPGANEQAIIKPASTIEIQGHIGDTAPGGQATDKGKKNNGPPVDGASLLSPTGMPQLSQLLSQLGPPRELNIARENLAATMTRDDWAFAVRGPGDVKLIANGWFPFSYDNPHGIPPESSTARGTLLGVVDSKTFVGAVDMTLQYAAGETPKLELGNVQGLMQDGSGFSGVMASIPGSWMGAFSGIYVGASGAGMYLGSLDGTFDETTGRLVSGGPMARTPTLTPVAQGMSEGGGGFILPMLFESFGLDAPGVSEVYVRPSNTPSFVTGAPISPSTFWAGGGESQSYLSAGLLSAWATTRTNDLNRFNTYIASADSPKTWTAKYGLTGYNYVTPEGNAPSPYFIVGDVTGYETGAGTQADPTKLRLSGRNLLFITDGYNKFKGTGVIDATDYKGLPSAMGYYNFELRQGQENGGAAGTLELQPTAFGGYWGYSLNNCLYLNDNGDSKRVGDEWGLMGAWTAPWNAPASINLAGAYRTDYSAYYTDKFAPAFLLGSPVGSRPDPANAFYNNRIFEDGDFFGGAAGIVGPFAQTKSGAWERAAKAAMVALYVKDGKAGLLTTFAPGSAVGGLTGGFYPDPWEEYGYWRLDGTLTATPMETLAPGSTVEIQYTDFSFRAGYSSGSNSLFGHGGGEAFYLTTRSADTTGKSDMPWGGFSLSFSNHNTYYGTPSNLTGKPIRVGGDSSGNRGAKANYWLGTLTSTWAAPVDGTGEISGVVAGKYLSQTDMGVFGAPFYGLYGEETSLGYGGGWIGEAVGTYSGSRLTFGGKIQGAASAYMNGIAGLWGSILPIADNATAINGILAMGAYSTGPTGETTWSAKTGGKWDTTSGKSVYWKANVAGSPWVDGGFTAALSAGRYMSLEGEGTVTSSFSGSYYEEVGMWEAQNVSFTLGSPQPFAFSSAIDGSSYSTDPNDADLNPREDGFHGIMGGKENDGGYSLAFLGLVDQKVLSPSAPFLSASGISSYIPGTSSFMMSYTGFITVATDSAHAVTSDIRSLYSVPSGPSQPVGGRTAQGYGYGGYAAGILYSDDITGTYDPDTAMWEATGTPQFYENSGFLASAELYDVRLGFSTLWQPQVTVCPSTLTLGASLVLSGAGFRGVSSGSGGNSQDSPTDYPLVQVQSLESGQSMFLPCTAWQTNSFASAPLWGFPPGYALATVFVNGIPSTGNLINISVPVPTAITLTGARRLPNGAFQFAFTNAVGALFGVLATTNPALTLSNWTALGGAAELGPGQFQFTDLQATNLPCRFCRIRSL